MTLMTSSAVAAVGICDLAKTKGGLIEYVADDGANAAGDIEIAVDVDGDRVPDKLIWSRTGSASIIPPDLSSATLTLSSTGKTFVIEDQRVLVVRYQGKYYVVTHSLASEQGPWRDAVYLAGGKGLRRICSFGGKGRGP